MLINMPQSTGVIAGMITHRMRATNPAHKPAHFAVNQRAKYQVIMIGHQLITEQLNLIDRDAWDRYHSGFMFPEFKKQSSDVRRTVNYQYNNGDISE